MYRLHWITAVIVAMIWPTLGYSANLVKDVKKAVERSTLDQPGTKPFHLKATLAPSFDRDRDSGRTGEVEIWWTSPTQWRRDVRSPNFHQIEIVNGSHDWQRNEGDYFPEWLRETAIALIKPVPPIDQILDQVKDAEVRHIGPMTNLSWAASSGTAALPNILRSSVAINDDSGLLLYAGGPGWGGEFKDYSNFHGRMISRTVNVGSPQVTARIRTLEDLGEAPAGFFDATAVGGDPQPLLTILMDEPSLRKNLLPTKPVTWPALQDGSLEGKVTTVVVVDREGKIREMESVVSENPGVDSIGQQALLAMTFKPFLINGVPVQAMSQIAIPFKTVRPSGVETFESARTYFERGRHAAFPSSGSGAPYTLRAEFEVTEAGGTIEKGRYEDTWLSDSQWRREAWLGPTHYVRSRNGEKTYQFTEGLGAATLPLVFKVLEPIPAIDTFWESDWRIKRETVNGVPTVRVLTGYESPDGKLDPDHARGYWFDDSAFLLKTYFKGVETLRSDPMDFAGTKIARQIEVLKDGESRIRIRVTEVSAPGSVPTKTFVVSGHEWTRAFTDEVR